MKTNAILVLLIVLAFLWLANTGKLDKIKGMLSNAK